MTRDAWRFAYRDKRRKVSRVCGDHPALIGESGPEIFVPDAMTPFEMTEAIDDARTEQENEENE